MEFDKIASRFTLPARALSFSADGRTLAAAGDDNLIKLIHVEDGKVLKQFRADYVRSICVDPDGTYLAAVQDDGFLLVFDVEKQGGKPDVRRRSAPKVDRSGLARNGVAWHPDGGQLLAAPGLENDVALYERLSWDTTGYLTGLHTAPVNVIAFSPNGLYALTAGNDKVVGVWDVPAAKCLAKLKTPGVVSGAAWHPSGNEVALITEAGELGVWSSPVPAELAGPAVPLEQLAKEAAAKEAGDAAAAAAAKDRSRRAAGGLVEDEAAEDDDGAGGEGDDDGIEDDGEGDEAAAGSGAGDDDDDDLDDSFIVREDDLEGRSRKAGAAAGAAARRPRVIVSRAPPAVKPQPPIAPGSTPADGGRPRFLAYNLLGAVISRPVDSHHVVEVVFHDARRAPGRVPLLTDYYNFTLASLGEHGALYGSASTSETPSVVMFRPFDSWATHSDWTVGLPPGEDVIALAAGATFCAAATSSHSLHVFTLAGQEVAALSLAGPVVALAAHGDSLAVVSHGGAPVAHSKSQALHYTLYNMTTCAVTSSGPLPLTPASTLTWLAFSEEGSLAAGDSTGVVRLRGHAFGGAWTQVFSAAVERKGTEVFWPVGLARGQLLCVVCKPETPHPQVNPRPHFQALPLQVPVLQHVPAEDAPPGLCSQLIVNTLSLTHARAAAAAAAEAGTAPGPGATEADVARAEVEVDGALLKLLMAAIKGERPARALELAAQLNAYKSLEGALKLANHARSHALAERITQLMQQRLDMEAAAAAAEQEQVLYGGVGGVAPVSGAHATGASGAAGAKANPFSRDAGRHAGNGDDDEAGAEDDGDDDESPAKPTEKKGGKQSAAGSAVVKKLMSGSMAADKTASGKGGATAGGKGGSVLMAKMADQQAAAAAAGQKRSAAAAGLGGAAGNPFARQTAKAAKA